MGVAALDGTRPFGIRESSWSHDFKDEYPKQWNETLGWLKRALADAAATRDRQRSDAPSRLAELRRLLRERTGASLFEGSVENVTLHAVDGANAFAYTVTTSVGISYVGQVYAPEQQEVVGVVVYTSGRDGSGFSPNPAIEGYLASGFLVIVPWFAKERKSLKGVEDVKGRHWYAYPDYETIHNLAFIAGASLAGMEAAEAQHASVGVMQAVGLSHATPLVVDFRGRHTLTSAVACALYPEWADVCVLHSDAASLLDQQQEDVRANTIWAFHKDFDGLTLFQLAHKTRWMFVGETASSPDLYARAYVWCADHQVAPPRVARCAPDTLSASVRSILGESNETSTKVAIVPGGERVGLEERYLHSLHSKFDVLDRLHEQARRTKEARYPLDRITPAEYRDRVQDAMRAVVGEPLPRAEDPNVRTRRVEVDAPYALYEVLMESLPEVNVAGYLMIPTGKGPFPAVICQHGLGGRPESLVGLGGSWIYYQLGRVLAEKGCVVFVPFMNWGWGGVPYRDQLAKHAYALGLASFAPEVAQLHAIVDFLVSRSEVRSDRIAFYGLSYGGHAAVWLCSQEPRLAAVVCAGHFNDWQRKLTSTEIASPMTVPRSYICVEEGLDMFNFNVLNLLGHPELATAQAPRPFLVENGLMDAVSPKAWVEASFQRVQQVYTWLGAPQAAALTHFPGPHRVWAEESLLFLREHLQYGSTPPN